MKPEALKRRWQLTDNWKELVNPCYNLGVVWTGFTDCEKLGGEWHRQWHTERRNLWTPLEVAPAEAWTGKRITRYTANAVQVEMARTAGTFDLGRIPASTRDDHGVQHYQTLPMEDHEIWGIVNRRLTRGLDTGEVVEDYRGYRDRVERRQLVPLPHGVTAINTEFFLPVPQRVVYLREAEWEPCSAEERPRIVERMEERGREGALRPEVIGMMRPLLPDGWVALSGRFWRNPSRFQVAELEDLPRRASYHGATVERITLWARPPLTAHQLQCTTPGLTRARLQESTESEFYISRPEVVHLPATMQDYRQLDKSGASWAATLFGTDTRQQNWTTVSELEPEFERVPLAGVGQLPGDEPAPFRVAMGKAQWKCAETRNMLHPLQGGDITDITTSRPKQQQLKLKADARMIDTNGVLCRVGVAGVPRPLPVVPAVRAGAELPEEWRGDARHRDKTWRHLFLHHSHSSLPRAHAPVDDMKAELKTLVFWETLDRDVESWVKSCRICASRSLRGRLSWVLKSLTQVRPHAVLVIDMAFVTPTGLHGEIGVYSAICIATKLVWFRPIWGKNEWDAGWALYAIVMDSRVVPIKILSDRDKAFKSKVIRAFTSLMGIKQGFSLAWSPGSPGLVEHEHYEVNQTTGKSLETLAKTKQNMWPLFLPGSENRRRNRLLPSGHTPLALSRGYYATTTLQATMGAIRAIPKSLPLYNFMKGVVATHKLSLKDELEDREERRAVGDVARNANQRVRPRVFNVGEQVLITHPKDIRSGHKLRGSGYGPWRVTAVFSDCVELADAFTGRQLIDKGTTIPDRINVGRLMRWQGGVESLEAQGLEDQMTLSTLHGGSIVAIIGQPELCLVKVTELEEEETITGYPMSVPSDERHGATNRRPWKAHEDQVIVGWSDIACQVVLGTTGCLSMGSVDRLRALGVNANQD